MIPSVVPTLITAATGTHTFGAVGLTFVNAPAVVGDAYRISPRE